MNYNEFPELTMEFLVLGCWIQDEPSLLLSAPLSFPLPSARKQKKGGGSGLNASVLKVAVYITKYRWQKAVQSLY